jgi:xanthine dehydrogenase large subunit
MAEWHPHIHDSARLHVTGHATYIDDLPAPAGLLYLAFGLGKDPCAHPVDGPVGGA